MSLPKTLRYTKDQLDETETLIDLHSEEIIKALTSEREYEGLYEDKLVEQMVSTSQQASNAETQFFNYESDLQDFLQGEKRRQEVREDHDISVERPQYQNAFRSASQISNRYDRLERQFRALSKVMEQNGMDNLREKMVREHPCYRQPAESSDFEKASKL